MFLAAVHSPRTLSTIPTEYLTVRIVIVAVACCFVGLAGCSSSTPTSAPVPATTAPAVPPKPEPKPPVIQPEPKPPAVQPPEPKIPDPFPTATVLRRIVGQKESVPDIVSEYSGKEYTLTVTVQKFTPEGLAVCEWDKGELVWLMPKGTKVGDTVKCVAVFVDHVVTSPLPWRFKFVRTVK